jgi:PAT family beta-lactamase induction signal transducer AmpG
VVIEAWGYPTTLLIDALVGPIGCLLLPAMKQPATFADSHANWRSRTTALVLGLCVLSFLLYWPNRAIAGEAQPIFGTFYTLVFVASALYLLAGREVLGAAAGAWRRASLWVAPFLFAMYGRYWVEKIGVAPLEAIATVLMYATPLVAGIVLLALARMDWSETTKIDSDPQLTAAEAAPAS